MIITPNTIAYCDMDGVLANWDKRVQELTGLRWKADKNGIAIVTQEERNLINSVSNQPGFYRTLEPMPGAIKGFKYLFSKCNLFIASTPQYENPSSYSDKRLWLEDYLGQLPAKRLVLTHNKELLRGDLIIDDRLTNGVQNFKGTVIHFGSPSFPSWKSIISKL